VYGEDGATPTPDLSEMKETPDRFATTSLVTSHNPKLKAALEEAFNDSGSSPQPMKAIVIVKHGRVVAERYAHAFGIDTPILSFSVAKSISNALLAILVRQGKLNYVWARACGRMEKTERPARTHYS
jgi:CubicO group peptidase (beta-lactamase class C family)